MIAGVDTTVVVGVIGSIVSSVGVVIANKYLYEMENFKYMVTLSCLHFMGTSLAMRGFLQLGMFEYKTAEPKALLPLSISIAASVVFMNLNLAYNSVGLYQMSKLMCVPCILLIQYFFMDGSMVSRKVLGSLSIILVGVGLATVSDVQLNMRGSVMAILAVLSTTMCQIWTGTKQKDLGLNAMQLLYHTAPYTAVAMFVLIPFFDSIRSSPAIIGLADYTWTLRTTLIIIITGVFAIGVNFTNFFIIGKTSAVTYQVVGHVKTCLVLGFGFIMFNANLDPRNLFGVVVAMVGTILYTEFKRVEGVAATSAKHIPLPMREKDARDLRDSGNLSGGMQDGDRAWDTVETDLEDGKSKAK